MICCGHTSGSQPSAFHGDFAVNFLGEGLIIRRRRGNWSLTIHTFYGRLMAIRRELQLAGLTLIGEKQWRLSFM
jgi:hypothetical protein